MKKFTFENLITILNHEIFHEKTLKDIFPEIIWRSLDGCSFDEMLPFYIDK